MGIIISLPTDLLPCAIYLLAFLFACCKYVLPCTSHTARRKAMMTNNRRAITYLHTIQSGSDCHSADWELRISVFIHPGDKYISFRAKWWNFWKCQKIAAGAQTVTSINSWLSQWITSYDYGFKSLPEKKTNTPRNFHFEAKHTTS